MADNFNGGDEHLSQWFSVNPNQQQQQTEPQQYQGRQEQMIRAPMVDDRNIFNAETASQHSQADGGSMGHQIFYPPPQYSDQSQPQSHSTEGYQQIYQHRGMFQQQMPPQQIQQQQQQQPYSDHQQQQIQGLGVNLTSSNSSVMDSSRGSDNMYYQYDTSSSQQQNTIQNSPIRMSQAQRNISDKRMIPPHFVAGNRSHGNIGTNATKESIALSKAKLRSERKRTREKQRRDGVNRQFAELTKVLKRLELEEREEADRKARLAAGSESSSSASLHSVRLPFIAPNNSVDLIACAIVHLQHLHRMSKRQQDDINRLEDELENTKKAGEDTAQKLKEVLFNYQMPRPHLGLTNPSFNVGNSTATSSSSSNNASNTMSNTGTSNRNNNNTNIMMTGTNTSSGNSKLAANMIPSKPTAMASTVTGSSQQKQQQVMMMVPVMMNMDGTATLMGQGTAYNMPGMGCIQPMPGSSSSNTNTFPSASQSAATAHSSVGSASASSTIPPKPSSQQRPMVQSQLVQQPIPYQVTSEPQQNLPPGQDSRNQPSATSSGGTTSFQQQKRQQQIVLQLRNNYLERQSQPISRAPTQDSGASMQHQQRLVAERSHPNVLAPTAATSSGERGPTPQNPVAVSGNQPAPSRGFEVALATALSNLRGGKADSEEAQQLPRQQQQEQQQQQVQTAPRMAVTTELSHNASSSDHAAALGSAIAFNSMSNPTASAPNAAVAIADNATSRDADKADGTLSSVKCVDNQKKDTHAS